MKLTQEQKDAIRMELLRDVKDHEIRSKIISTAYGFAHENGEDGDLESMVYYQWFLICFLRISFVLMFNGPYAFAYINHCNNAFLF